VLLELRYVRGFFASLRFCIRVRIVIAAMDRWAKKVDKEMVERWSASADEAKIGFSQTGHVAIES
jgi:hypothetical protein